MADRIHYACGKNILPDWLNVDGADESFPYGRVEKEEARHIFFMDLTQPHPFPDESFVYGYAEDFLEHLDQPESIIFLCEAYRTLKPGGVIRLSFPGLRGVLKRHLRSSDYEGAEACRQEAYVDWWHNHFYCFESIDLVGRHIGFRDVRRCAFQESDHPGLAQDTRVEQEDLNLIVELTR
jgi:predicted SAM-dependent methyltransferase